MTIFIKEIIPTVFLKDEEKELKQLVYVVLDNPDGDATVTLNANVPGVGSEDFFLGIIKPGESKHEIYMKELSKPAEVKFTLNSEAFICDQKSMSWTPPKHWIVHVVQASHHDAGYTDLQSNVYHDHYTWLDDAITYAEETNDYPADAQFRIQIEQAWSLEYFLRKAPPERATKMIELLRSGRFEVNATFGNMTTEICGPEVLARTLYAPFRLKRNYGIPIASAEHNDITGFSWGLCQMLTDADIQIFIPGIPLYYDWDKELQLLSFWDTKAIFGSTMPGMFWWEAPSGKHILLWCGNTGCGGDSRPTMPGLGESLMKLEGQGYAYSTLRWPVNGGVRDNSPYIKEYASTIRDWNEKWTYPRLICSTNSMFYADIRKEIPENLPVIRGELPGQDYPVGATSTAAATARNRNNHADLLVAEKLAVAAEVLTDYRYDGERLSQSYEETLWYDEHTWGHHFPCGPSAQAAEYEKAIHAYRAAALTHDVIRKALARIADHLDLKDEGFHLVVYNAAPFQKTGPIKAPMREMDNCGNTMAPIPAEEDPEGTGFLRGVILTDRWPAHPSVELVEGNFDLIDMTTGETVPFQMIELESHDETVPYASQRLGVGSGTRRYGFFELPLGLKRNLCFIAKEIPAYGYKTYCMMLKSASVKESDQANVKESDQASQTVTLDTSTIENEFYCVQVDDVTGAVISIFDKSAKRELVDAASPFSFHSLVVRSPLDNKDYTSPKAMVRKKSNGPICFSLEIISKVYGHPKITQTISLYQGIKQIYMESRILKDAAPLLDVHLAFPFALENPQFRYEGVWSAMTPIADYLPGAYSDTLAVQNWVKITNGAYHILWSSLDAPIVGLSGLWPGYVSPAHRCFVDREMKHDPLKVADLKTGAIYLNLFYNNLSTNFAVSQVGDVLFRYVMTSGEGEITDSQASSFGWQAVTPLEQMFTQKPRNGHLTVSGSFIQAESDDIVVLNCKKAEDHEGYIIRLWNTGEQRISTVLRIPYITLKKAYLTNVVEENIEPLQSIGKHRLNISLHAKDVVTIRIIP